MSVRLRPLSAEEMEAFHKASCIPFLIDPDPARLERMNHVVDWERARVAEDSGQIVATFAAYTKQVSVPGGKLPMAGTTIVSVLPTHRRKGLMRGLMTEHLKEVYERGEPLAGLWASESSIYGRFGYGPAANMFHSKLVKQHATFQRRPNCEGTSLRLVSIEDALQIVPEIYRRAALDRPGMVSRCDDWWKYVTLGDQEFMRQGMTRLSCVIVFRGEKPVGYTVYRANCHRGGEADTVQIKELVADNSADEQLLWQFLFDLDLVEAIHAWNLPVDSPVAWWLNQPRKLERKLSDSLWIRPIDVGVALAGRRYSGEGRVTFRFRDELCPWNEAVWQLDVDRDGAGRCEKSETTSVQLELDPYSLGAIYLGGQSVHELARAGLVQGESSALDLVDRMFSWTRKPWCAEVF